MVTQTKPTWTPGPLSVEVFSDVGNNIAICGPDGSDLTHMFSQDVFPEGTPDWDTQLANAQLWSLAPEMVEALRALFEHCVMIHSHWGDGSNAKQAGAAIASGRAVLAKLDAARAEAERTAQLDAEQRGDA